MAQDYILLEDGGKITLEDGSGSLHLEEAAPVVVAKEEFGPGGVRVITRPIETWTELKLNILHIPSLEIFFDIILTKVEGVSKRIKVKTRVLEAPTLSLLLSLRHINIHITSSINSIYRTVKSTFLSIKKNDKSSTE